MSLILNAFLYMLTVTSVSNNKDQPKQNKKHKKEYILSFTIIL